MPELEYLTVGHLSTKELTRIFSKVEVDPVTHCWNWIGSRRRTGYGQVYFRGKREDSHRVVYAWLIEPLPRTASKDIPVLDHIVCDNPPCCNPVHLQLVTQRKNILRGNSVSAKNARKTHCSRNGHLLPLEPNHKNNQRCCRQCKYPRQSTPEQKYQKRLYDIERRERIKASRTSTNGADLESHREQ